VEKKEKWDHFWNFLGDGPKNVDKAIARMLKAGGQVYRDESEDKDIIDGDYLTFITLSDLLLEHRITITIMCLMFYPYGVEEFEKLDFNHYKKLKILEAYRYPKNKIAVYEWLRRMRNSFAHHFHHTVTKADLNALWRLVEDCENEGISILEGDEEITLLETIKQGHTKFCKRLREEYGVDSDSTKLQDLPLILQLTGIHGALYFDLKSSLCRIPDFERWVDMCLKVRTLQ